MGLLVRI